MLSPPPWLAALAIGMSFAAGWQANGWRLGEQIAAQTAEQQHTAKVQADAKALDIWVADQHAQVKIQEANDETERLERCIASGHGCGLRVKTVARTCSDPATGVDSGTQSTAQLDPSVGPDYRTLRAGIVRLEQALKVCVRATEQP